MVIGIWTKEARKITVNTELKHIVAEALELPVGELASSSQAADFQAWDS